MATNPFDTASYLSQRRNINTQAQTAKDRLQYDRQNFEAMRRIADQQFQSGWNTNRARVPNGMARRGLINSGIYNKALAGFFAQKMAADFSRGQDTANQLANFNWQMTDIDQQKALALNELEAARQGRRSELASQLQQFRSN
jgi:hypothetical protein